MQQNTFIPTNLIYDDLNDVRFHTSSVQIAKILQGQEEAINNLASDEMRLAYGIAVVDYELADEAFHKLALKYSSKIGEIFNANYLMDSFWKGASDALNTKFISYMLNAEDIFMRHMQNYARHAMFEAVQRGDSGVVHMLFSTPYTCVNDRDEYGNTPLHYSVLHNMDFMTEFLIEHGALPYVYNTNFQTPYDMLVEKTMSVFNTASNPEKLERVFKHAKRNAELCELEMISSLSWLKKVGYVWLKTKYLCRTVFNSKKLFEDLKNNKNV